LKFWQNLSADFRRLILATLFFGAVSGIILSTLNNYLSAEHAFDASNRGWLEFPRELPGFLIVGVMGFLLARMRESRIAALAMVSTAVGVWGLAYLSDTTAWLVVFIIIWSLGDHIIFAVEGPLGLKLAKRGGEGRRLGQLGGARNVGVILGVSVVWLLTKFVGPRYDLFYLVAGCCAVVAGALYWQLHIGKTDAPSRRLVFRKEYKIFYAISALFGIRKQIFMVFGTWVLVSLHDVPVSTIAILYFIASAFGVLMRPLLGDVIDWAGERLVLSVDEIMLIVVCLVYAFASHVFDTPWDLRVLYAAYILDHILFALRIARTTYLKKIALDPADITPTISLGITIDHVVAMSLPVLSGYIWERYGHEYVFLMAAAIALGGFFICLQIKVPTESEVASS